MEFINPESDVVKIEREKVNVDFMKRKSQAKTYRGHLSGCIAKCKNDGNIELQKLYEEELEIFNKFYPLQIIKIEVLQGYKDYNKALPDIWKNINNDVMIRVWHKEGYEDKVIGKGAINRFIAILRRFKVGEKVSCYRIAKELGYGDTEKEAWETLWGKRMTDYFPNYYYVCLFLDKIGFAEYGKRGSVVRLK